MNASLGSLRGVHLNQIAGVPYRLEMFKFAQSHGCEFSWGADHFPEHIVTTVEMEEIGDFRAENRYLFDRRLLWQSGVFLRQLRSDILVMEANPRYINNYLLPPLRRIMGKPTIFWGHFDHHSEPGKLRKCLRVLHRRIATMWVSYTETEADRFGSIGVPAKAAPNPLPPCNDPGFVITSSGKDLLYLGRIDSVKGLETLIRAMPEIKPDINLHVVGDGPLKANMESLCTEIGVEGRVSFYGFLPCGVRLHDVFSKCRTLIVPTYVGLNLTQALAHGLSAGIHFDRSHSPEIEVARLFPERVVGHDGTAKGIADLVNNGTPVKDSSSTQKIKRAYSVQSWLDGLAGACCSVIDDQGL